MVRCTDLGYFYRPDDWVFRGYNIEIAKGSVAAILGPNGAGKTTLLKILLGLLAPKQGTVEVSIDPGFVPQVSDVSFDYLVIDMVLMGRARSIGLWSSPGAEDKKLAWEALEHFGLAPLANRSIHEISGGQRQLVIIARALVTGAGILILDEPTASLDFANQRMILEWMEKLSRERSLTVVFTTHHPHHAAAVADQVLLMNGPHDFIFGPTAEVLNDANLRSLYGVDMRTLSFLHNGQDVTAIVPVLKSRSKPSL